MFKAIDRWLPGYIGSVLSRPRTGTGTRHLLFCLCDHFEPFRGGVDAAAGRRLVQDWVQAYPSSVESFRDSDGNPPRHTFFYPQEEYDAATLDILADFCGRGYGEVEIHLHHRHDTADGLRQKLESFRDLLRDRHGLLGTDAAGRIRYGFIHGNWALCNSRPDGDWCGVNEELGVLARTGCYADFTFPSAPSPTQPRMVNAIYRARDVPGRPRGADRGERMTARAGGGDATLDGRDSDSGPRGDGASVAGPGLPVITGPLALNWSRRKWGILPRLENAELSGANPPTPDRLRIWARQAIHVVGRPDWVFVKVHTHGCVPANRRLLFGPAMQSAHRELRARFGDGRKWQLHYVTAREMFNLARAAENGASGAPGPWRDVGIVWHPQRRV